MSESEEMFTHEWEIWEWPLAHKRRLYQMASQGVRVLHKLNIPYPKCWYQHEEMVATLIGVHNSNRELRTEGALVDFLIDIDRLRQVLPWSALNACDDPSRHKLPGGGKGQIPTFAEFFQQLPPSGEEEEK